MNKGTALAFDFGLKRTGVASGELEIGIAHPLTTIVADGKEARLNAIDTLVKEWQPGLLVVGLPMYPDGAEHEMTRAARNFAGALQERYSLPVFLHDERYSSSAAEQDHRSATKAGVKLAHAVDARAAQHILQGFFDARTVA